MTRNSVENVQQEVRDSLINTLAARRTAVKGAHSGQLIAAFYRCRGCGSWWIVGDLDTPETIQAFKLVEPHSDRFLWPDYRGWRRSAAGSCCDNCGEENEAPDCELRFDEKGRILWPRLRMIERDKNGRNSLSRQDSNPFADYVSSSEKIGENMFVIAAWEARQELNAPGYTADINDIRDELNEMRTAFKDIVYGYAPLLPPGWRVTGDFDNWLKGRACAGFLHGEIRPDISLMVGGCCTTVAELEMQLDRLFRVVCEMC